MFKELVNHLLDLKKSKKFFYSFILIGYIFGVIYGYSILNKQYVKNRYCAESSGVSSGSCQWYGDCGECFKYYYKSEPRSKEAFYTYGLLGAFIGGWIGVLFITYILKE